MSCNIGDALTFTDCVSIASSFPSGYCHPIVWCCLCTGNTPYMLISSSIFRMYPSYFKPRWLFLLFVVSEMINYINVYWPPRNNYEYNVLDTCTHKYFYKLRVSRSPSLFKQVMLLCSYCFIKKHKGHISVHVMFCRIFVFIWFAHFQQFCSYLLDTSVL